MHPMTGAEGRRQAGGAASRGAMATLTPADPLGTHHAAPALWQGSNQRGEAAGSAARVSAVLHSPGTRLAAPRRS